MASVDGSVDNLLKVLTRKKRKLEDLAPEAASRMGDALVAELQLRVPGRDKHRNATGNLQRALTKKTTPYRYGSFWAVGVGDMELLGHPGDAPPRGTIDEFLYGKEGEGGVLGRAYTERRAKKLEREADRIKKQRETEIRRIERNKRHVEGLRKAIDRLNDIRDKYQETIIDLVEKLEENEARMMKVLETKAEKRKAQLKERQQRLYARWRIIQRLVQNLDDQIWALQDRIDEILGE